MLSILSSIWVILKQTFKRRVTISYPEERSPLANRLRGRIVLTRDPDGEERCVACFLCSSVCPVDCIAIEADEDDRHRRIPKTFRINFSRCIFCGMCEEACPTLAIQLSDDFEMSEYSRQNLYYEKEHLLIDGCGKHPHYSYYRHAGISIDGRDKGMGLMEKTPVDIKGIMP